MSYTSHFFHLAAGEKCNLFWGQLSPEDILCDYLFQDYYRKKLNYKTATQYIRRNLPVRLIWHYAQPGGQEALIKNCQDFANQHFSLTLLAQVCQEIHHWLHSIELPQATRDTLEDAFPRTPTRHLFGTYLGTALFVVVSLS